jgi:hypothetical protein
VWGEGGQGASECEKVKSKACLLPLRFLRPTSTFFLGQFADAVGCIYDLAFMNSDSSSPPDISSLSLSPHRLAPRATDGFDLDAARQYHYQTSPPVMPTQNPYANPMPANLPNTPIKPSKPTRAGLPSVRFLPRRALPSTHLSPIAAMARQSAPIAQRVALSLPVSPIRPLLRWRITSPSSDQRSC